MVSIPPGSPGGQDRDDARMLKARGDLDLASKSLRVDLRARVRRENLDDDATGERGVGYEENVRHASATELALDGEGGSHRRL